MRELAALARPEGPWVVIDGYHAFMAIEAPIDPAIAASAFYLGGGYKYAMAGEGMGFMHCPPGFGERPPITGWYAEFGELTAPPGSSVGYTQRRDALHGRDLRSVGAVPVQRHPADARGEWHDDRRGSPRASPNSRRRCSMRIARDARSGEAELLNPLDGGPHARFLAFRDARAQRWCAELMARGCVTDVRGDVLRIGFGLYHDEEDVDALSPRWRRTGLGLQAAGDQVVGVGRDQLRRPAGPTRRNAGRGTRSSP